MNLTFQREVLTSALIAEMLPLLQAHWSEVAHFADIPLEVDEAAYLHGEGSGQVRCYVARSKMVRVVSTRDRLRFVESSEPEPDRPAYGQEATYPLVGYAVYLVRPNPHYKSSIQASQDVLYLHPSVRGNGSKFIAWCDDQLRAEGVQAVYHHVKVKHDFGKLLERQGYEKVDEIWAKRLDVPVAFVGRENPAVILLNDEITLLNIKWHGESFRVIGIDEGTRRATVLVDGYEASDSVPLDELNKAIARGYTEVGKLRHWRVVDETSEHGRAVQGLIHGAGVPAAEWVERLDRAAVTE